MAHLKKNVVTNLGVKASKFAIGQSVSWGLKVLGYGAGPIGWIASFLGKKIIDNVLMPHVKAIGINANRHYQARQAKKTWRAAVKHAAKDGLTAVSYTHLTLPTICSV